MPDSIISISDYAFYECTSLTDITIPDSVTRIWDSAFYDCSNLESITIGTGLKYIGENAFYNCTELSNVYISDIEQWLNIRFYNSYSNPMYNATHMYIDGGLAQSIKISDSITTIPTFAFYNWTSLKKITIPDSIIGIGSYAFYNTRLTSVTIPEGVTSISSYTFGNCTALTDITIPESVTSIGSSAFSSCSALSDIYYGGSKWTWIAIGGNNASISSTVTIHYESTEPLADTSGNIIWTLDNDGTLAISGEGAMSDYSSTSAPWYAYRNYITSAVIENGVTSIGNYVFYNCTGLTSIAIPDSVTSIGNYSFYGCTALKSITIPNIVTNIGKYAFYNTGLTNVIIPEEVTSINSYTFGNCIALTSVVIPNSVTSIVEYAFYNTTLTDITIPESVTSIGKGIFNGSSNLEEITLPFVGSSRTSNKTNYAVFGYIFGYQNYSSSDTTEQYYKSSSSYIPSSLTNVTITSATQIPYGAFYNCSNITDITIADSVTDIGDYAFYWCSNLTNITIPNVASISSSMLENCITLKSIVIPTNVKSIGSSAFCGCTALSDITMMDSVTSIGENAFYNTAYYNDIGNWNEGALYIGKYFVEADTNIEEIFIINNETKTITDYAFYDCTNLTSVLIPQSVSYVGKNAFLNTTVFVVYYDGNEDDWDCILWNSGNDAVKNAIVIYNGDPALETVIEASTCSDSISWALSNFGNIVINGAGTIPDYSSDSSPWYKYANFIQAATIEEGITGIGDYAFYENSSLTNISISTSVTSIASYSFTNCDALTDVYYAGSESAWKQINGYDYIPSTATVYYAESDATPTSTVAPTATPTAMPTAPPTTKPTATPTTESTAAPVYTAVPTQVPTVTQTETDDAWSFTITLETTYADSTVYAAAYDESGALLGVSIAPLNTGSATEITLKKYDTADSVKIFVWNSNMQPISAVWENEV